jgi:mannose-6-phosphate isomerase-like protein (cupin superfamily)
MTQRAATKRYAITRPGELQSVACPCGEARRAFVGESDGVASLHITDISAEARTHYHKRLTEIYYILEGEGEMELDGDRHAVRPGDAILIKPLCRHRAIGKLRALIVPVRAFDPADEWFD